MPNGFNLAHNYQQVSKSFMLNSINSYRIYKLKKNVKNTSMNQAYMVDQAELVYIQNPTDDKCNHNPSHNLYNYHPTVNFYTDLLHQ